MSNAMFNSSEKRIGLLFGPEGPFPYDLIKLINSMNKGVKAEAIRVGAVPAGSSSPYDLIIDRISHCVPFFREYTKNAFLTGTYVINNPFRFFLEKYFGYGIAEKIGVKIPKTVLIPPSKMPPCIESGEIDNVAYPIIWGKVVEMAGGFPVVLKPAEGGGWQDVYIIADMDELMDAYDLSGSKVMVLQEYIRFEHYVRVLVFGKKHVMPIRYNPFHKFHPEQPAYIVDHHHLSDELGDLIAEQSLEICRTLDYDMNSVEFAIKDGVPYAIDFCNQVPDARPEVVTPHYYRWILEKMADVAIDYALNPPPLCVWDTMKKAFRGSPSETLLQSSPPQSP